MRCGDSSRGTAPPFGGVLWAACPCTCRRPCRVLPTRTAPHNGHRRSPAGNVARASLSVNWPSRHEVRPQWKMGYSPCRLYTTVPPHASGSEWFARFGHWTSHFASSFRTTVSPAARHNPSMSSVRRSPEKDLSHALSPPSSRRHRPCRSPCPPSHPPRAWPFPLLDFAPTLANTVVYRSLNCSCRSSIVVTSPRDATRDREEPVRRRVVDFDPPGAVGDLLAESPCVRRTRAATSPPPARQT